MAVTCIYCGRPEGTPIVMADRPLDQDGQTVHPARPIPRMDCCIRCLAKHNRGDLSFGLDRMCSQWGRVGDHCTQGHHYEVWS